jgi:hypothetical protein
MRWNEEKKGVCRFVVDVVVTVGGVNRVVEGDCGLVGVMRWGRLGGYHGSGC